jgi:hypothetical protein
VLEAFRFDYLENQHATQQLLQEIAESLDCLAARPDDEKPRPASYESAVMVASLKASWLKMNPEHTEAQYTAAMRRFEQLAGL